MTPILFTPGPVRIPQRVARALSEPPCNYHRQPDFQQLCREIQSDLAHLLRLRRPEDYFAAILTCTGTGANEGCLQALSGLGAGLILNNGFFGARLVDQAVQNGLDHHVLSAPVDQPLSPAEVASYLDAHPEIRWCYFVSHETRMGLVNPMVELGKVCHERGVMVGADVISSAFGYPIDIEAAHLDLAVTSSAKAVMAAPGLGVVMVRRAAAPTLKAARGRSSYYLDVIAEYERQASDHQPRFAQPVALFAALHAACAHLREIGIDTHMARIQRQMDRVAAHLANLGLHPLLPRERLSWIAVNFALPAGMVYSDFARKMQDEGYFLLYGVPGDQSHFQVSTIGDLSDEDVAGLCRAFDRVLGPACQAQRIRVPGDAQPRRQGEST
ncbi:MAG: aminotransferase class V-fold PLP-dependent enzyme [Kofleriaceae bacterium]